MPISSSNSPKNINPLFVSEDPKKNNIFWRGMYALNQLNSIMSLIISGGLRPDQYKFRYAPRIYTYKQYIYEFLHLLDDYRDINMTYIYMDARQTLKDFDECVQNYISTYNERDEFKSR